jgi:hypothetical protein
MRSETVLALAKRLRSSYRRLVLAGEAKPIMEDESDLLELLVARLKEREAAVAECSHVLSDRLNNMLMGIQTVSDQLRQHQDQGGVARLRSTLDEIVERGRESLRVLREAVAKID